MPSMFNHTPSVRVDTGWPVHEGWESVCRALSEKSKSLPGKKKTVVIECYQGVLNGELLRGLEQLQAVRVFDASRAMYPEDHIREMVYPDLTDDRVFGYLSRLNMEDYYDPERVENMRREIRKCLETLNPGGDDSSPLLIYGPGASLVWEDPGILVYADMARWEIQQRMRRGEVPSLGIENRDTKDWMLLYKQGYFVDWRVCDRLKKKLFHRIDYLLDTNRPDDPCMLPWGAVEEGLNKATGQPFSVVPFFDPGPWGGQWMKEKFGLDPEKENYAWCFNCVPEENSLLLEVGDRLIEIPSVNLVFMHPRKLLGDPVHARFGDEFPIRFDYLDTMGGGNLSLQVHPLTEYIQEKFGMHYTQDESYYLMDADEGAGVYLGLKTGIDPAAMVSDLRNSQETGQFEAEKYVQKWPAKKHDHFLIPGGTVHCSGAGSMVLEISATPYIFTFKLWDWGRMGLDGNPRPIHIDHGEKVIQWERTTEWTRKELVNRVSKIAEGEGWTEERTGLHEREFIETRRHWFTGKVPHSTGGSVHVLNLVEGKEILVESPTGAFDPLVFRYAETFIVPAAVGDYTIKPVQEGERCATIKAFVRV